jgi:hypothetical protein
MICGIIMPRQTDVVSHRNDGYLAECILESGHLGHHIVKTLEGKFYAWEDDWGCGCCEPDEDDRCYTYWELSEQEVANSIAST